MQQLLVLKQQDCETSLSFLISDLVKLVNIVTNLDNSLYNIE